VSRAGVQATFAATLVDEWVRAGVTDAVVCPGSRSTPMAVALAADGRLRLHVLLDERSAGFFAVGLGRATGRPAVVLTTSGTAAVELHPAVVEASYGRVPMLAVTANRPPELHDVGAPQTVDQAHLFGRSARWFAAPGVPGPAAGHTWRSLAARAVAEATGSPLGPVHLDLAFGEPLVGEPGGLPPGRDDGRPWHERPVPPPAAAPLPPLAGRRVLVVAGEGAAADEGDGRAVLAAAERLGWPVLADPRSGCRLPSPVTVAAGDALLRAGAFAEAHRPDAVVRLGAPPASKLVAALAGDLLVVVDRHGGWADPARAADAVVAGHPAATLAAVAGPGAPPGWLDAWRAAEAAAQDAVDAVLSAHPEPSEPGTARTLAAALPDGAALVTSSSMPVREVEWFARPRTGLRVLANRGANGIDGVTSTALGVAAAWPDRRTALLTGDLAFLHDGGGLVAMARDQRDLLVVVCDNDGGGIFELLPQAQALPRDRFELLFGTPHRLDLAAVAAGYGLPVTTVEKAAKLEDAISGSGPRVVVVPADRRATAALHAELGDAVGRAVGA
jgi:2-succinyl-5-enolpyruvyl-6-hydroxy-3-cyclohexene-1-carboxylate synthase